MKFSMYPPFRARVTVSVWLTHGEGSFQPDAKLRVSFFINHRDDLFSGCKTAAESTMARLGVPDKNFKDAQYEYEVDGFIAIEPRGVKNPDREPVEAFSPWFFESLPDKKKGTLIRQRRLVPCDQQEMVDWYATPARKAQLSGAQAVPA